MKLLVVAAVALAVAAQVSGEAGAEVKASSSAFKTFICYQLDTNIFNNIYNFLKSNNHLDFQHLVRRKKRTYSKKKYIYIYVM